MNELNDVITLQEASKIWKKDGSTLRRVITGNLFTEGVDYRKSGKIWLIKRSAMERVYGEVSQEMSIVRRPRAMTKNRHITQGKEFIDTVKNFKPEPYSDVNKRLEEITKLTRKELNSLSRER